MLTHAGKMQVRFIMMFLTLASCALAGMRAARSVTTLQEQADLIVIAQLEQVVSGPDGHQGLQLRVQRTLQGTGALARVSASLDPPADPAFSFPNGVLPKSAVGKTGVWFLVQSATGYEVLPIVKGDYVLEADIYIHVSDSPSRLPQLDKTVTQQLLAYLVQAYFEATNPGGFPKGVLLSSLHHAKPEDSLAAIGPLLSSDSLDTRALGLEVAIELGSDEAITRLVNDISQLKRARGFTTILRALKFYQPNGEASIPVLKQLIGLKPDVPGLEGAAAAALAKIQTRAVLPIMIELLDSPDPEAVDRAATFCGFYTLFADANGNLDLARNGAVVGPLSTPETRAYPPSSDPGLTPAQYAQFWKGWWARNKTALGFTTP